MYTVAARVLREEWGRLQQTHIMMCAPPTPCGGVTMAGMSTGSLTTVAASSVAGNGVPWMGLNGVQALGTESQVSLERSPSHAEEESASN